MIRTPDVQVQQDISWLGDVGKVVSGLIQKYPEMQALDQAAKDEKQGKVNTYRGLRQGLERAMQDDELVSAIANDPTFGGDKDRAVQYLQEYAERLTPSESEGSGEYHKRAVDTFSELATGPLFKTGELKNRFATTMTTGYIGKEAQQHIVQQLKRDQIKNVGQGVYKTSADYEKALYDNDLFDHEPSAKKLEEMKTAEKKDIAYKAVQETVRKLYANELVDADGKPIIAKNLPVHEFARVVHANIGPDAKEQAGDIIMGYVKDKELELRNKEIDLERVKMHLANKGGGGGGQGDGDDFAFETWKTINANVDKAVEDFNTQLTNLTSIMTSKSSSDDEKARAKEQYKMINTNKNALIKYKSEVGKAQYASDLGGLMKVTEDNRNLIEDTGVAYLRNTARGFFENRDYKGFKEFANNSGLRRVRRDSATQPYAYYDSDNNMIAVEDSKGVIKAFTPGAQQNKKATPNNSSGGSGWGEGTY